MLLCCERVVRCVQAEPCSSAGRAAIRALCPPALRREVTSCWAALAVSALGWLDRADSSAALPSVRTSSCPGRAAKEGGAGSQPARPSCWLAAHLSAALRRQTLGGQSPAAVPPSIFSRSPGAGSGPGQQCQHMGEGPGQCCRARWGWGRGYGAAASSAADLPWKGTVLSCAPSLQASRRGGSCLGSLPCWASSCRGWHSWICLGRHWSVIRDRQDCTALLCSGSEAQVQSLRKQHCHCCTERLLCHVDQFSLMCIHVWVGSWDSASCF